MKEKIKFMAKQIIKKGDIKRFARAFPSKIKKVGPEILIGIGIAGFIFGTIYSIRMSNKAINAIETEKKNLSEKSGKEVKKLPVKNLIKATWKIYLPVVVADLVSTACIIGSNVVHLKRHAAIIAAYTISESARKEYETKVKEVVGSKKAEEIEEKVAEDRLKKSQVLECTNTGHGTTLCFDYWTGRYFWSDKEYIRQVINDCNGILLERDSLFLDDLYYDLGLELCDCGSVMGWNLENGQIRVKYSSKLTDTGIPCLTMEFITKPTIIS